MELFHVKRSLEEIDLEQIANIATYSEHSKRALKATAKKFMDYRCSKNITGSIEMIHISDFLYEHRHKSYSNHKSRLKKLLQTVPPFSTSIMARSGLDQAFRELPNVTEDRRIYESDYFEHQEIIKTTLHLREKGTKRALRAALLIEALYESGCRVSELLNAKSEHLKPTHDGYELEIFGKGMKKRSIFLSKDLVREIKFAYHSTDHGLLFPSRGSLPMSQPSAYMIIKRAFTAIYPSRKVHPHMLRHSRAMQMKKEGFTVDEIQHYLGHHSSTITSDYYLHSRPTGQSLKKLSIRHP